MVTVVVLLFLAGFAVTPLVWLWLRSRRDPIALVEPLDIGRVFQMAFRVFTPAGWPVVAAAIVLIGIPQALSALLRHPVTTEEMQQLTQANPGNPFAVFQAMMSPAIVIGGIVGFLSMMAFYVGTTIYLVSRAEGAPVAIGEAFARSPARAMEAFGAIILAGIGMTLGATLFVLPGIILALNWMLIVPVISCENAGFFGSFSRSRFLALGSRGRILLLFVIQMVAVLILSIPGGVLSGAFGQPNLQPGLFATIWGVILGIVLAAFQTSFFASLYIELRRIREGLSAPGLAEVFA